MIIEIKKIKCRECGHEWQPRHTDIKKCPRCQYKKLNVKKGVKNENK